VWYLEKIT